MLVSVSMRMPCRQAPTAATCHLTRKETEELDTSHRNRVGSYHIDTQPVAAPVVWATFSSFKLQENEEEEGEAGQFHVQPSYLILVLVKYDTEFLVPVLLLQRQDTKIKMLETKFRFC